MDTSYLASAPFNTKLSSVLGKWALILSLIIGGILTVVLHFNKLKENIAAKLSKGAMNALLPVVTLHQRLVMEI